MPTMVRYLDVDFRVDYDSWQIPQKKSLVIIRRNVCSVGNGYCIVAPEKYSW